MANWFDRGFMGYLRQAGAGLPPTRQQAPAQAAPAYQPDPNKPPPGEDPDTWRERLRASNELTAFVATGDGREGSYDARLAEQRAREQAKPQGLASLATGAPSGLSTAKGAPYSSEGTPRPSGQATLSQQAPTGLAQLTQQPPPSTFSTTVPLGSHERDRMQQDNTSDADAWWRNRGNY